MKKLILLVILLVATPVWAGERTIRPHEHSTEVNNEMGAKLDAPNLIRLSEEWTIGAEGGKDFWRTDMEEGYFVYGKVTYNGTWLDLSGGSKNK